MMKAENISPNERIRREKIAAAHRGKPLSPEHKSKIGAANKGKVTSPEQRNHLSIINKGKRHSEETKVAISNALKKYYAEHPKEKERLQTMNCGKRGPNKGKRFSDEWRQHLSESHQGPKPWLLGKHPSAEQSVARSLVSKAYWENNKDAPHRIDKIIKERGHFPLSEEGRSKISKAHKGRVKTPEQKERDRLAQLNMSDEAKEKRSKAISAALKGKKKSAETVKKFSEISKQRWQDPIYKIMVLKKMIAASSRKPTVPEKMLMEMLNKLLPNQYKYVGAKHEVVINACNPDFININGQKKVIEMFGDWYHSPRMTGKSREQEEIDKMNNYRTFGFDCLIIWEHEIKKHPDEVKKRILAFHRKRHKKSEIQPQLI